MDTNTKHDQDVRKVLRRRRWALERRIVARGILAMVLIEMFFGPVLGQLVLAVGVLALLGLSQEWREEIPKRLVQRHKLRPMQAQLDAALLLASPEMLSVTPSPVGDVVTCAVVIGNSVPDMERQAATMAAALSVREVRVRQHRENAGLFDLIMVKTETLSSYVEPSAMLARYRPSLYNCVPLGIDEEGRDVVIGLVGHHLLVGGEPGGGKSGTLSVVLAAGARDPNCDIWCFDGKLVELEAWRPVAKRVIGSDMAEANAALDELVAEMDRRYKSLLSSKKRKVEPGDGETTLLVVVDELAFYVANADKKAAQAFSEKLRDLVARARAAGIVVVAATQKPSADLIPSALRDNFGYRLAHRCATKEASDTILGSGWASEAISASSIDPRLRGVGYLIAEGGTPRRIRVMHLDDQALASVVAEAQMIGRPR